MTVALDTTRLSQAPTIHPTATVEDCRLGCWTEIGAGCSLVDVALGDYSYIVDGAQAIHAGIGKFANIAAAVRINPGNHPIDRASLHHFTYRSDDYWPDAKRDGAFFAWRRGNGVAIGHDVWIGHGAVVLPGTSIGDGAVVGAEAVVTREVAPYAIVAGVPARTVRARFPAPVAERLRALAWWDWTHDRLRDALDDFRALSAEAFLEKHE